jgi:hypothetical protein
VPARPARPLRSICLRAVRLAFGPAFGWTVNCPLPVASLFGFGRPAPPFGGFLVFDNQQSGEFGRRECGGRVNERQFAQPCTADWGSLAVGTAAGRAYSSVGQSAPLIRARSVVRLYLGPPLSLRRTGAWGGSSIGRASALQAGGCRFNPGPLHHPQGSWGRTIKIKLWLSFNRSCGSEKPDWSLTTE